jgi:hypothetical protein
MTPVAVAILVIENHRNAVSAPTGAPVDGAATPAVPCHVTRPPSISATAIPGAATPSKLSASSASRSERGIDPLLGFAPILPHAARK